MELITLREGIKPDRASENGNSLPERGLASYPKRTGREGHFKVKQIKPGRALSATGKHTKNCLGLNIFTLCFY